MAPKLLTVSPEKTTVPKLPRASILPVASTVTVARLNVIVGSLIVELASIVPASSALFDTKRELGTFGLLLLTTLTAAPTPTVKFWMDTAVLMIAGIEELSWALSIAVGGAGFQFVGAVQVAIGPLPADGGIPCRGNRTRRSRCRRRLRRRSRRCRRRVYDNRGGLRTGRRVDGDRCGRRAVHQRRRRIIARLILRCGGTAWSAGRRTGLVVVLIVLVILVVLNGVLDNRPDGRNDRVLKLLLCR